MADNIIPARSTRTFSCSHGRDQFKFRLHRRAEQPNHELSMFGRFATIVPLKHSIMIQYGGLGRAVAMTTERNQSERPTTFYFCRHHYFLHPAVLLCVAVTF